MKYEYDTRAVVSVAYVLEVFHLFPTKLNCARQESPPHEGLNTVVPIHNVSTRFLPLMKVVMDELPPPPPYSCHDPNPRAPASMIPHPSSGEASAPRDVPTPALDGERVSFVSGAAYFATRPPQLSRTTHPMLSYPLTFLPGPAFKNVDFPWSERDMLDRDVNHQDWKVFLNHLMLYPTHEEDIQANSGLERQVSPRDSKPPQLRNGLSTSCDIGTQLQDSKSLRRSHAICDEWNRGFFLPRSLKIILQLHVESAVKKVPVAGLKTQWQQTRTSPSHEGRPKTNENADVKTERGMALYEAVSNGDKVLARLLLDNGADADSRPVCGVPALTRAVKAGDEELVQMLLEKPPDLEAKPPAGATALYTAVSKGETALVRLLLTYGANPNAKPSGGEPALYRAASKHHLDIAQLLLEYGSDVEATPPGGESALSRAVSKGESNLVRLLLDHGANPNAKPSGGDPALYRAASKGNSDIVELLLEHGCDVDAAPPGGSTALYQAAGKGNLPLMEILLKNKANTEKTPPAGQSALHRAASKGETSVVKLLLKNGANVETTPPGGNPALYNAISKGYYDTIQLLLDYGASIDAKGSGGKSALAYATKKGDEKIVRLLLQHGVENAETAFRGANALS